jgi:hypothetical protein
MTDYENTLNYIEDNNNLKKEKRNDVKSFTNELEELSDIKKTNKTEIEKVKIKKTQAMLFDNYMKESGISTSFQLIFTELLVKNIKEEDHFTYAASRLRQIGRELEEVKKTSI